MLTSRKIKIIGIHAVSYIDNNGKRKTITAKKHKELFKNLNKIFINADKKGAFWKG